MINSLLTLHNEFISTEEILKWIQRRNKEVTVNINTIPFRDMKGWHIDEDGCLRHDSGKFFSIQGLHVETDYGRIHNWDQPIINQPEIGYLGILTKEINGTLYFLMQAKIEPGNVNCVQISPTLQATKSNYTCVHGGTKPAYLDFFVNAKPENIILDQLQSEQGARFSRKRNRNIIIKVEEDIEVLEDFRWMTLGQIKELMYHDNVVNMDTRTVISGIDFAQYMTPLVNLTHFSQFGQEMIKSAQQEVGLHSMNELLSWLSNLKSLYDLSVIYKAVNKLHGWHMTDNEIANDDEEFFKVIGVDVEISNREVKKWSQPLIAPMQQGLCCQIIKKIGGTYHFLMQAKLECGNFDVMELAPTVQCLTGNVRTSPYKPEFSMFVLDENSNKKVLYDVLQSEEGGRFYHEQNRNMIVEVGDDFPVEVHERYIWMTLGQIFNFIKFNNFLNIQARSILSAIKYL
ncbi:MAG: NDP-hexose 2,3-dehydratase family protein [Bacteroidales bacterium]|nr:NDP-hexose 2,3-dehydratase family protein [Bacteroidales bacterium]